jgi:hypothetical protein
VLHCSGEFIPQSVTLVVIKDKTMADKHKKHHEVEHEVEESAEPVETTSDAEETKDSGSTKGGKLGSLWHRALAHKKVSIPAVVVLLLALLAAVPFTRYALAGLVLKQQYQVAVVDAESGKPVSSASVTLDGTKAVTDNRGRVNFKVSVGSAKLEVTKNHYETVSQSVVVPIQKSDSPKQVELKATGRPVPVAVLNKITKQPAANVVVKAEGSEVKTDKEGKAVIVLPPNAKEAKVTLSGEGFNATEANLQVTTDEVPANTFEVTPAGKLYFLSNASGKIDLVKSNLDGSDRKVVLAGTGKEDRYNTVLLASRDWKYIALLSKRDGGEYAKLFLIETANDTVTTMDEGQASFGIVGWSGDRFVYTVTREKIEVWQPKRQALKSYSASAKKITLLDETNGVGDNYNYVGQQYGDAYVLDETVVFVKTYTKSYYSQSTQGDNALMSVKADGSQKKTVKSYTWSSAGSYIGTRAAEFGEIYIQHWDAAGGSHFDAYQDGKVSSVKLTENEYYNSSYPTYVVSPTGKKTLWSDFRDGKNVFFVGDGKGENGTQIGASDEFTVYGWFSDDYLLITKKGSEMRILPADGLNGDLNAALKVTDYYKPSNYYQRGFGYGYGG